MLKKTAGLFATAYLLIIFCIYPFYVQDGYVNIGSAKNQFFLYVSFAAFGIMGILGALCLLGRLFDKRPDRQAYLIDWDRVSSVDLLALLYGTEVFLSYVLTDNRKEALWGTEGWYIGCALLLLLCGLYFCISRLWNGSAKVLYALTAASAAVFLLGICNRFSVYPIPFEIVQPGFLSTLGNINWYCGYLSVIAPIGIGIFVLGAEKEKSFQGDEKNFERDERSFEGNAECFERKEGNWNTRGHQFFCGLYAVITFMTAFSQGSNSIFLWFAALFFILLWISLEKLEWFKNWLLLVMLWGVSAQFVRLLRFLFPGKYNYETNNMCGYFTDSSLTLWIAGLGAAAYAAVLLAEYKRTTVLQQVKEVSDSQQVKEVFDSQQVKKVSNSQQVKEVFDSQQVKKVSNLQQTEEVPALSHSKVTENTGDMPSAEFTKPIHTPSLQPPCPQQPKSPVNHAIIMKRVLAASALTVLWLWLLLSIIYTKRGIPFLQENAAFQELFLLNDTWGNGRGAAIRAGADAFREFPFLQKLFGAGPDCFSIAVYARPESAALLQERFGAARLTNAHNELLTCLVNTGILGVCFYTGLIIAFIRRCMKKGKKNPVLYLFAASVFCYLIHNMVSFAQVLNLPFLFLFLGMGEALLQASES